MFGKKNKNQKKQWIIGFCGLLVIGVGWRNAGCEDDNIGFRY